MSGWHDFVQDTLAPIYNAGQDLKKEVLDDTVGIYKWGKDTVSKTGNLATHTIDNATNLEDSLADALAKIAGGLGDTFSTPWLLVALGVGAVLVLKK